MATYETEEKIYALATPYYPSALAIIRVSGEGSIETLSKVFSNGERLLKSKSNTLCHGYVLDGDGNKIDEVVLAVYKKGHGYTSEEAVEITMHGSLPLINKISLNLERIGFRKALPGEFTYRAFMHGRLDLTEAEAVEEIVSAKSEEAASGALERLSGNLSTAITVIKEKLIDILSSLEVQLDYAEDEILEDWVYPEEEVREIISTLDRIIGSYDASRLYAKGAKVVLAGKTNAGKSSFFNALLKENRAIVSEKEGTTRDYIEAECVIKGLPVRLFDTAGLRDASEEIEKEGIERSRNLMREADLVVYVTDGSDDNIPLQDERMMVIYSKLDEKRKGEALEFSSVTGEGISDILDAIANHLVGKKGFDGDISIESERQKDGLSECRSILSESMAHQDVSVDLMAISFQSAIRSLNSLIGDVSSDEILDNLFSKFCLGK